MSDWAEKAATEAPQATKTPKTPEELATATDAFDKAKNDTQQNLSDLNQAINKVTAGRDGIKRFTEELNSNQDYKKQVEQILGTPSWESRDSTAIKGDIQTLQKALGVKEDGALGPNTFKELKVRWENRTPSDQDYKTFIDGLMNRGKVEGSTAVDTVVETPLTSPTIINAWTQHIAEIDSTKDLKLDEHNNKIIFGNDGYDFELKWDWKTLGTDRDAYKIMDNQSSYDLNIRWKEDNIRIDKQALFQAISETKWEVLGTTLPKKGGLGEPVMILINKKTWAQKSLKGENGAQPKQNTTMTSLDTDNGTRLNISRQDIQVDQSGTIVVPEYDPSRINLLDMPPPDLWLSTAEAARLKAQVAIQPVVDDLKDNSTT